MKLKVFRRQISDKESWRNRRRVRYALVACAMWMPTSNGATLSANNGQSETSSFKISSNTFGMALYVLDNNNKSKDRCFFTIDGGESQPCGIDSAGWVSVKSGTHTINVVSGRQLEESYNVDRYIITNGKRTDYGVMSVSPIIDCQVGYSPSVELEIKDGGGAAIPIIYGGTGGVITLSPGTMDSGLGTITSDDSIIHYEILEDSSVQHIENVGTSGSAASTWSIRASSMQSEPKPGLYKGTLTATLECS